MFRPVFAGIWQHHQVFDGTYSFYDLMDAHELLDVREENERRAQAWADQQKENK